MISLYPFDGPCAACQCVVTVGKGHRSRLPTSDPASEGVDGRPGYEVGWLVHAYYLEECSKCGYFAPHLSTPYPALADVARARDELLSVQARGGHAPDALRFMAVASLFGDADPRETGSWLLRAAWLDEEGDFEESARPLRLRAAALLEDALYEGYAFAPSRLGSSLALAESLRIGGAFDRALEHCARGLRFSQSLPLDDRKTFLFETWCVLQRRVDPLTRGAALAGYAALDGPTTNGIVERLRATAAALDPIQLRPQRMFHHPTNRTSRSFADEAALFAADFMDGDLMIDLLRQGHTGVWETVCLRPHYFPDLLRATDHAEPAVRKQAIHALYNHSFPFKATVLEGHADAVDALVRRLGDAEEEPVRFAAAILKQVVRIDASFTARVVEAAAAALPRWKADLSTTGALERLVDLGTVLVGGPDRRARTVVEMYFAASLRSCVKCGAPPRSLALSANGDRRTLQGPCPFCGTPASFGFFVEDDPEKNTPPSRELGGAEPSKVVTAAELASELGRLKELGIDADTRGRALTCVLELLKQPDMDASTRAARIEDRDRWLREDAPHALATLLSRPNVRCVWARVPPRAPFQVSDAESPATYRWSADGNKLWTCPERPGAEWSQWDRQTGDRLRRARVPDDVALRFLPPEVATALVGRKPNGRAAHTILSCSPDLRRVVLADSHGEGYGKLCNVADGSLLATLSGMTRPFAFSVDGEKLVAPALGKRALLIVSAKDGAPIAEVPFTESLSSLTEASWAPGGELLFNIQVPGHDDDRLLCFSVDQQRTLWSETGYFPSMQISPVSHSVAAFTRDGAVRILDIPSGVLIRSIAKEDVRRPL